MKKLIVVIMTVMVGCATSSTNLLNANDEAISNIVQEAQSNPESFGYCMKYHENITLTPEEELALFEHCMGI
jgi:outer membrane lipoprotein-sorting protein